VHQRGDTPVPGYTLTEFLGRGGYGEVWRASAPGGVSAALKMVSLSGTQGLKEYRAVERIKAIRHANLLPIHAFWVLDGDGHPLEEATLKEFSTSGSKEGLVDTMVAPSLRPALLVMAMPLGDKNLFQRLAECRAAGIAGIPPVELLNHLEDAARAIDYLNSPRHDLGEGPVAISHGDVKPQNIMLVGTSAQLCDFGLARVLGPGVSTTTGGGTPAYIPPEMLETHKPSATSDQYSLAVSYIELRTGRLPFSDSGSYVEVLDAHLKGALDFSALPAPEQAVIRRAAARQPQDRYPNCQQMVQALRAACPPDTAPSLLREGDLQETKDLGETPAEKLPLRSRPLPQTASPAGKRILAGAAVVGLLMLFLARGYFATGTSEEPAKKSAEIVARKEVPKEIAKEEPPKKAGDEVPKKTEVAVAKKPEVPPLEKSWTNSVGMKLLLIPAGEFIMGSPAGESGQGTNETPHPVSIRRPFYLAAHEVTQRQFQEVTSRNPSHFSPQGPGRERLGQVDPLKLPVEKVTYADAVDFCEKLAAQPAEKAAGRSYRLPTEAEWEYACRAGTKTRFWSGDELSPKQALCDFGSAGGVPQPKRPATVGLLAANPWGLFDMHGNVAEWCSDWYTDAPAGGADPQGPAQGTDRVLRGGGFYVTPAKCRSADRFRAPPETSDIAVGFRVVCETESPLPQ